MNGYKTYEEMEPKERRDYWHRRVKSSAEYINDAHEKEVKQYLRMYRHQFQDLLPETILKSEKVDVNVVYPIIKTLIPKLYFQDPKAFIKALEEKIVMPRMQAALDPNTGMPTDQMIPLTDPLSGQPVVDEYDGPKSALILQGAINENIRAAKLKSQVKLAIYDAHLGFYGALKTGWGNEQGVQTMGDFGFASHREDVNEDIAYGIRLKPWDVLPDLDDFYNQKWTAIKYCVHPEVLKRDKRLKNTAEIKGTAKPDEKKKKLMKHLDQSDTLLTEYYEVYVRPSTEFPEGLFLIISEEVKEDFLYEGVWPYKTRTSPIKFLYFNPDPEGGLPVPDVRYYANQQKMKSMSRRVSYEFTQRSVPFIVADLTGVSDQKKVEAALRSGQVPRIIVANTGGKGAQQFQGVSFPNLTNDFYKQDAQIDDDISRMVGMVKGVYPASGNDMEFAAVAKIADQGEAIRQNERADIVKDFLTDILCQWVDYFKEFAGPENYTTIDGQKFPTFWTRDMIQMRTKLEIKPFSMSYEDPVIRRRQWVDLLNLLISPAAIQALAAQGAYVDFLKIINRILETYDERDVESFVVDEAARPENQVGDAIMEGLALQQGIPHQVKPTDNHKVHIMIHELMGLPDLVLEHQAALVAQLPPEQGGGGGGGGNQENPNGVNGNAASQEQLMEPLQPSSTNQKVAVEREATKTR